jgi:glutamate carboxypeptidase
VNSDEEIGSAESSVIVERLAQEVQRTFVLEPSLGLLGNLKTARKGVGRFEVVANGRAAHAGLEPEKGISAVLELSYQIQNLFAMNDLERGISVNVGTIEGGLRPNVVAPTSKAIVDVRVPSMEYAVEIERAIYGLEPVTPEVTLMIKGGINRPPLERTPANRRLWTLARELGESLGLVLEEAMAGGGSDGNTTSQFTATLDGLGAVGDGAHARHEFIFIDKMIERCALLVLLLTAPTALATTS